MDFIRELGRTIDWSEEKWLQLEQNWYMIGVNVCGARLPRCEGVGRWRNAVPVKLILFDWWPGLTGGFMGEERSHRLSIGRRVGNTKKQVL